MTMLRMYMLNVEQEKKKHESVLFIFCIILAGICKNHGSWLKCVFRNDQYLHFIHSLLLNVQHYFFVVLNSSFCWRTCLFSSLKRRSPKSIERRKSNYDMLVVLFLCLILKSVHGCFFDSWRGSLF